MITPSTSAQVLEAALSTGGDFAEIFLEDTDVTALTMIDGKMDEAISGRDHGAGVRVLKGTDSVYVYTNDTSPAGLLRTARQAAAALDGKSPVVCPRVGSHIHRVDNHHPIVIPPATVALARKAEAVRAGYYAAKEFDPCISQSTCSYTDRTQRVVIVNSLGTMVEDVRTRIRYAVSAVASQGSETQTGTDAPGWKRGFEAIEALDPAQVGRNAARVAVTMLRADYCPAGRMPVAIENGFGGVLFHEACGHSLEATSVAKGHSVFCGKLGQRIASDIVTAIDDGTMVNAWGSNNIDDEGNPTQRTVLIENGILKNYLVDTLGGRRMGMAPNGCSRRQSYAFAPTSRMSNTYIAAGSDDNAEIIATMGDGLYCAKMGGGSVNPVTGEFNFAVQEGYLVRDGKIDKPVRGATLIGKGSEVLLTIDRVGRDMRTGQGMCGSLSGSIPTDVGQPLIRISAMTVGGRKKGE